MVNKDLVEGLRTALSKGSTLEQAMMSFYNAGYKKLEIEEAARALYAHPSVPMSHPAKPIPEEIKKPISKVSKPITPIYSPIKPQPTPKPEEKLKSEETKQIISKYEEKTKPKGKLIIILLIISLFLLTSLLIGIFIFKNELIDFFGALF